MHEYGSLPRARQDGLFEEMVGEELLLYDQHSHTAHCLSPIAASVWQHCDGEHDLTELAILTGAGEDFVADALRELREKGLLVADPTLAQSTVRGESRREAIGRVARYGGAAAGSMIVSATAATPAMAASGPLKCCQCVDANQKNCKCIVNASYQTTPTCKSYCETQGLPEGFVTGTECVGVTCTN